VNHPLRFAAYFVSLSSLWLGGLSSLGPAMAEQVPGLAAPGQGGPEVLTRGPIHEAFATPVIFNPTPPIVVPNPPPQSAVEEIPPDQKPVGADVEWIPGYWAWDDQRNDYIWVSGVWRDIPPGRQWVPGYWSQVNGGFGWTSGFWAPTGSGPGGSFNYLPSPPESLENGPNSPQPGDNFAWAPGSWVWQNDHYGWQPGFWYQARQDWVWSPSTYQATPSGYVYNDGFWDYSLARRGLPFAPVAFGNGFGNGPLSYTPNYVLPVAGLLANLFVRPNYGHYYYGDYYNGSGLGANSGYVPWFGFQNNRIGYDPIYASMAALNSRQPGWDRSFRDDYRYRLDHQEARPLSNFAAQREFVEQRRGRGEDVRNLGFVEPIRQWANNPNANHQLVPVGQDHRLELGRRQAEMANFQGLRLQQEERGRIAANIPNLRGEGTPRGLANPNIRAEQEQRAARNSRAEQGQRAQANQNLRAEQSQKALFRNEMPRSPVASAANPRFESRGLAVPPPNPQGHESFRPQFGPNHAEVPTISHRGAETIRQQEVRPAPRPGPERERGGNERPRR